VELQDAFFLGAEEAFEQCDALGWRELAGKRGLEEFPGVFFERLEMIGHEMAERGGD
jgi:hypothetical protein